MNFSIKKYKFFAFDLSKSNTGVCICYLNENFEVIELETKSLVPRSLPYYGTSFARDCHFLEIEDLSNQIEEDLIKDDLLKFIVLETPVYRSFTSELAYFYFQSVLNKALKENIDCIGVVPMSLKKYVGWIYDSVFGKKVIKKSTVLDKSEIKFVYDSLKPLNYFGKFKMLNEPRNNDEMDAFFLMLYILTSFNKNYLTLLNREFLNPKDYELLEYTPIESNTYNLSNHIKNDYFTLKDRKFYPLRYFKKINFI